MNGRLFSPGKYVITGGAGFGKTSLVVELSKRGFKTVGESSRELIEKLMKENSPHLPWLNRKAFQELILERRITDYLNTPKDVILFFDRGLPDEIAYYEKDSVPPSDACLHACKNYKYDKIFLLPPWKEIFRNDSVRRESFEESSYVHDFIKQAYERLNYVLIDVPKLSVEERADFVLEQIKSK